MKIKRAVITAASRDDRHLPLQQLVDRDRQPKAALAIIVEEAVAAGAHEVAVVIRPGDEAAFREAAGPAASRLELIPQPTPAGYGDALCQARASSTPLEQTSTPPFLVSTSPVAAASPTR